MNRPLVLLAVLLAIVICPNAHAENWLLWTAPTVASDCSIMEDREGDSLFVWILDSDSTWVPFCSRSWLPGVRDSVPTPAMPLGDTVFRIQIRKINGYNTSYEGVCNGDSMLTAVRTDVPIYAWGEPYDWTFSRFSDSRPCWVEDVGTGKE